MAAPAGVGAGGILAAAGGLFLGDVALLVVAAGDVVQARLWRVGAMGVAGGTRGGALGAVRAVD